MAKVEVQQGQQVQQPEKIRAEDDVKAAAETAQIAGQYGKAATRAIYEILAAANAPGQNDLDKHNAA